MKEISCETEIETEYLVLRNLKLNDVSQKYVDWLNDSEINKYLKPTCIFHTMESCLDYVRSYEGRDDKALIGIFMKSDGLHIGNVTLSTIDWQNKAGTIGICIGRKEFIGKGFGKEVLSAVVRYCFLQLGLSCLQAYISANNVKSLNLFEKCGFKVKKLLHGTSVIDGRSKDDYIVTITNRNSINDED